MPRTNTTDIIRSIEVTAPYRSRLAHELYDAMESRGLTTRQLAQRSGLSKATVHMYVTGVVPSEGSSQNISLYALVGLAHGLGAPASTVIGWATDQIIANKHIAAAEAKASERIARMAPRPQAPNGVVATVSVVPPAKSAVSVASVMLKVRSLKQADLELLDELIEEMRGAGAQ